MTSVKTLLSQDLYQFFKLNLEAMEGHRREKDKDTEKLPKSQLPRNPN